MAAKLDQFTDEELLTLCALADAIYEQLLLGKVLSQAEAGFLTIMADKQLWAPQDG